MGRGCLYLLSPFYWRIIITIQHKNIAEADLHEPKGVSTAGLGKVYVSDGAGSGSWIYNNAQGSVGFSNVTTPISIAYPSAYTKIAPTTTASGLSTEFTEANTARLTYTGTLSRPVRITGSVFLDQDAAAARNIRVAIYKNGSIIPLSETITGTTTGSPINIPVMIVVQLVTNDYVELFVKNDGASGAVRIYNMWLGAISLGRS